MPPLAVAAFFLLVGLALLVAEVFIPSFGILLLLSVTSLVGAVIFAFQDSALAGYIFAFGVVLGAPALGFGMLRIFPRTRLGKKYILSPPERGISEPKETSDLSGFLGKKGVAKSLLRPTGIALIEGERVDVVTEGLIIESGTPVEVVEVNGNRIVVKKSEE